MFAHPGLDRYATGSQTQRLYLQNLEDPSRSDLTTRVLFEGTRGVGVAYLKDGIDQQVRIKKEVILSARAINSPQILLLSGVGPADILQTFDIPIVAAVPGIGHNLQNHLGLAKCWIS
jgi:choline dehydrogenase